MPDSLILKRAPASWSRRHRWTLHRLGDRLGIAKVFFCPLE
jgi:hypothetical protein